MIEDIQETDPIDVVINFVDTELTGFVDLFMMRRLNWGIIKNNS